ncbi:MarR family winged helix-turn-helix transcriptional regulator [Sphingomonas sp. 8AM]|uniref:MarR family winged helix-turn-helix transcriptional regulator n=1 Tax=Sphingomonas sp. 8AM TaxID=2653170 RepID=UPI0012EF800E|nr:MarR family transcriptional regulator [Sphingomonas sp. 8AM]VXC83353.1 Organic hydroperoxide resistance transcriptional regulator [Sphingomonas sp. 8AM]
MADARPLDEQLCFSLYSASMAVGRAYKPLLDAIGITYPQYLVLHALWEQDARTIGAIAERLALESSTVTPLVKRLEVAGHVARQRNPDDERQVRVLLTESGRELRQRCGCLAEELVARSGMSLEQLASLNRQVAALRAALAGEPQS